MRDTVGICLVLYSYCIIYVILSFRFSALVRDKPLCTSWEKKMEAKREKELVKRYTVQLKEAKDRQKEVSESCATILTLVMYKYLHLVIYSIYFLAL